MTIRKAVGDALEAHRRDPDQHDVWLPMVRCRCGATVSGERFRSHMADEITKAVAS